LRFVGSALQSGYQQHILNTIMSTADLLKIIMAVGIVFALLASRWISKQTAILAEENHRADQKID